MPDTPTEKKFEFSPALSILAAGALIAGAIIFVNRFPAPVVAVTDTQPTATVNVTAPKTNEHIIGSATAPIVLVEYSDFQCPFCSLVHPTLKKIVEESNGQIAWVYRNFPLDSIHPQAKPAALAAECIADELGNDAFWKFADAIFADQKKMSPEYYAQLAKQFGADPKTFAACVSSEKFASKIEAQSVEAQTNGGQGTPYTIVYGNGIQSPVSGALPYAQFMAVIKAVQARQ